MEKFFSPELRDRYLDWHFDRIEAIREVVASHAAHFIEENTKNKREINMLIAVNKKNKKNVDPKKQAKQEKRIGVINKAINAVIRA